MCTCRDVLARHIRDEDPSDELFITKNQYMNELKGLHSWLCKCNE